MQPFNTKTPMKFQQRKTKARKKLTCFQQEHQSAAFGYVVVNTFEHREPDFKILLETTVKTKHKKWNIGTTKQCTLRTISTKVIVQQKYCNQRTRKMKATVSPHILKMLTESKNFKKVLTIQNCFFHSGALLDFPYHCVILLLHPHLQNFFLVTSPTKPHNRRPNPYFSKTRFFLSIN